MGAADDRDGARRLRNADRPGVLGLCRVGPFSARNRGRGRHPHDPALLLQIPRRRKDRGRTAGRSRLAARRAFLRHRRFRARPGFCQAVEAICGIEPPPRARALRTVFAELERLRSHAAAITGICNSTALAVATSQAALIEEDLLRLSCEVAGHRYLFGSVVPGGVACDLSEADCRAFGRARSLQIAAETARSAADAALFISFLDRLEEVGIVAEGTARSYGLVGPIARASGVARDIRKLFPYAAYDRSISPFRSSRRATAMPVCAFCSARRSNRLPSSAMCCRRCLGARCAAINVRLRAGAALAAVEAPLGAAFHWLRLDDGRQGRALSGDAALVHELARLPSRGGEFRVPGLSDHSRELRAVERRVRSIGVCDGELGAQRAAHRHQEQRLSQPARRRAGSLAGPPDRNALEIGDSSRPACRALPHRGDCARERRDRDRSGPVHPLLPLPA